jgi:hypothetical protein
MRAVAALLLVAACGHPAVRAPAPAAPNELLPPSAFDVISDRAERSRALFAEAARVLLHPRCVSCHPDGDAPMPNGRPHDPPVARGPDDAGERGLPCGSCHQDRNLELVRVPGAPGWRLAPRAMAWQHRSPSEICAQLLDRARNGGRSPAELVAHAAHDPLVAWGWAPGADRQPAPGTQERFGALVVAWLDSGAACPVEARP